MSDEHELNTAVAQDAHGTTAEENVNDEVIVTEEPKKTSEPECYPELREVCREGDIAQIRHILEQIPGLDLNISDPDQGYTPLFKLISTAVMNEDAKQAPECVRLLVSHGADLSVKDANGWTGLHHCARWNNNVSLDIAKVLIELGADPSANQRLTPQDQPDAGGETHDHDHNDGCTCGTHVGAALGAAYKLATGKDLDLKKEDKELDVTPLHHACGHGNNMPLAKLLLDNGAKVHINDAVAGTPVLAAVKCEREDICELLLSKPGGTACLSIPDNEGRLPIHYAAENGSRNLVAMLVEAGSLVNSVLDGEDIANNRKGFTPLLLACQNANQNGKLDVIKYLLDHGADVARVAGQKQTAIALAVVAKNVEAAKLLQQHGADISMSIGGFEDVNALHLAGTSGAADLCRWLVEEAGLGVDTHDDQGYTALISAAGYSNSPETIRVLVSDLNADIEASIHDGRRPLHFSAFKGQEACAKELLSLGANKEATDDVGWTPLHFAARYHHPSVIRLLLDSGAQLGKTVNGGPQPKLKDGEEIDIDGFTAADLARITRGGQECSDMLVASGDPISEKTKDLKDEDLWEEKGGKCCVM